MSNEKVVFPIEFSADGKRNAFSHPCNIVGHSKAYAVCLSISERRSQKGLDALYGDCLFAIGKKSCPALAMRAEELNAGKAIYFRERIRNLGETLLNAANEMIGMSVKKGKELTKEISKTPLNDKSPLIDSGSYAEAINLKSSEVVEKPVIEKPAPHIAKPAGGETLIEMAKRMMREKNELK